MKVFCDWGERKLRAASLLVPSSIATSRPLNAKKQILSTSQTLSFPNYAKIGRLCSLKRKKSAMSNGIAFHGLNVNCHFFDLWIVFISLKSFVRATEDWFCVQSAFIFFIEQTNIFYALLHANVNNNHSLQISKQITLKQLICSCNVFVTVAHPLYIETKLE